MNIDDAIKFRSYPSGWIRDIGNEFVFYGDETTSNINGIRLQMLARHLDGKRLYYWLNENAEYAYVLIVKKNTATRVYMLEHPNGLSDFI